MNKTNFEMKDVSRHHRLRLMNYSADPVPCQRVWTAYNSSPPSLSLQGYQYAMLYLPFNGL